MNTFFSKDHLTRATPEETKFAALHVEPYPDGYRVLVKVEVTPFQKRPHLIFNIYNNEDQEVASTTIIESLTWKFEFTMHIRGELLNPYKMEAKLFYPDGPSAEPRYFSFEVNPPQAPFQIDSN